ncbi:MAG TPA: ATP-binding cassette domain-containing protein [Terriglobales bacterium]|nr:ATP-binding cassette domain-containing protein [Terriglobales bacterium]
MTEHMLEAAGITKRFGATQALAGIDLAAPAGSILGVLGPNGAGKTTAVRILTTLTLPDSGRARVAGHDVVREPAAVRRHIGVAAQAATLDETLTGRQNLQLVGELSRMRARDARARAAELLSTFELTDAGGRVLKTYSGGMKRRLDLAASMMTRPSVLFLDEPTTGLDPTSRLRVWSVIRELVDDGVTVLLTTQYLDEADHLADRIVVIDHGRVIAEGTSQELKRVTGGARLEATLTAPDPAAVEALRPLVDGPFQVGEHGRRLRAPVRDTAGLLKRAVRALDEAGVDLEDVAVHQPTLDDVFLRLTGSATETAEWQAEHSRAGEPALQEVAR